LNELTDFHTHILPEMDDGAGCVEESLVMLRLLSDQGVRIVALTPHYYRSRESIPHFLSRRERTLDSLLKSPGLSRLPQLLPGAEVAFFSDMPKDADIRRLCISGTDALLLEMPIGVWTGAVVNIVFQLISLGVTPIIAHIERYTERGLNAEALDSIISFGAVIQSNAEFFLELRTRRRAFDMLGQGKIHIFGSDCHNLAARPPNMGRLTSLLSKKLSRAELDAIAASERRLLVRA
jgi:protein-tyrosine phosphatase